MFLFIKLLSLVLMWTMSSPEHVLTFSLNICCGWMMRLRPTACRVNQPLMEVLMELTDMVHTVVRSHKLTTNAMKNPCLLCVLHSRCTFCKNMKSQIYTFMIYKGY